MDALVHLPGMRGQPGGAAEGADQLIAAHSHPPCQVVQRRGVCQVLPQLRGYRRKAALQRCLINRVLEGITLSRVKIADERNQRGILGFHGSAGEQQRVEVAELAIAHRVIADADRVHTDIVAGGRGHFVTDRVHPVCIQMQHLVVPALAGQGIAGMHAPGRHHHHATRLQHAWTVGCTAEDTAASIHGTDRERGMAVRAVTGTARAGTSAFDVGHARVSPEFGGGRHGMGGGWGRGSMPCGARGCRTLPMRSGGCGKRAGML